MISDLGAPAGADAHTSHAGGLAGELGLEPGVLAPLLEGARARGVADAFELMGVAAIMLDRNGAVLHVSSRAAWMAGGPFAIAGGHLIGATPESNRQIEALIVRALAGGRVGSARIDIAATSGGAVTARAVTFRREENEAYQLVRAIVLFEEMECMGGISASDRKKAKS